MKTENVEFSTLHERLMQLHMTALQYACEYLNAVEGMESKIGKDEINFAAYTLGYGTIQTAAVYRACQQITAIVKETSESLPTHTRKG